MTTKQTAEILAFGNKTAIVDYAIAMNRVAKETEAEVAALKPYFREQAQSEAAITGDSNVYIVGLTGAVQVVFPAPTVKAKVLGKDRAADLLQLEAQLPAEVFNSLFRKKTIVEFADDASDYQAKLSKLPAAQQALLKNYVEVVDSTPRVAIGK